MKLRPINVIETPEPSVSTALKEFDKVECMPL
jgi:hypothetical protein